MIALDKTYWEQRYEASETGWDIGAPSTPLTTYIDQLADKELRILVPGAGNGHEVVYLWEQGFRNVYVLDIAEAPLANLKQRLPEFPDAQLVQADFFDYVPETPFDLIFEQTFFCALHPRLRPQYAEKMKGLLQATGKLVGVLFNIPLNSENPPFGGNIEEYRAHFLPNFNFKHFETCYNSIPPRAGNEVFICLQPSA